MVHCCVAQCGAYADKTSNISLFRFPRNVELQKIWIRKMRLDTWEPNRRPTRNPPPFIIKSTTKVCSRHFLKSDIICKTEKKRLKPNAIPRIFHWQTTNTEDVDVSDEEMMILRKILHPHDEYFSLDAKKCLVHGCTSSTIYLPKGVVLLDVSKSKAQEWLDIIGDVLPQDHHCICSRHFHETDIEGSSGKLKKGAKPSKNLETTVPLDKMREFTVTQLEETTIPQAMNDEPLIKFEAVEVISEIKIEETDLKIEIDEEEVGENEEEEITENEEEVEMEIEVELEEEVEMEEETEIEESATNSVPPEESEVPMTGRDFAEVRVTKVCRICFRLVLDPEMIILPDDSAESTRHVKAMLALVLPELDLTVYPNTVICLRCCNLLTLSADLKNIYNSTEQKLNEMKTHREGALLFLAKGTTEYDCKENLSFVFKAKEKKYGNNEHDYAMKSTPPPPQPTAAAVVTGNGGDQLDNEEQSPPVIVNLIVRNTKVNKKNVTSTDITDDPKQISQNEQNGKDNVVGHNVTGVVKNFHRRFQCQICDISFNFKKNFEYHLQWHKSLETSKSEDIFDSSVK